MEELAAFLARQTDITSVTRLLGMAWRTVGRIVRRVGVARLDPDRWTGLTRIGVDEFSYRKRHRYLTVVLDHDTGQVVWASKGMTAETLHLLRPHRTGAVRRHCHGHDREQNQAATHCLRAIHTLPGGRSPLTPTVASVSRMPATSASASR